MAILLANNAKSALAASLGGSDTSLTVTSGTETLFPSPTGGDYFYVTIEDSTHTTREIVKCTSRTGNVLTIVRAQDGSFANIFAVGSTVEMRVNKATITDTISAATSAAASATASASSASTSASTATTQAGIATTQSGIATTQAGIATTQATDAANSATAANNSAIAAAAAAASGLYAAVQDKSANYTVVLADSGDLIRVTTTSGAITITLPAISAVGDGFKIAVVKWTSDPNAVNINRVGSDTINGGTTAQIGSQYSQIIFVADLETATWFASQTGLGATNVNVDVFSGTGSQTAFTLSADPSTKNNTNVYIGGVYQAKATYSVSGTTFTFSTAPPAGTNNIEIEYASPLAIGTPSDGTVTTAKIVDANVTAAKLASGAAVSNIGYTPANQAGDSFTGTVGFKAILETATITASAPAATTHFDMLTQAVQYYTTNTANNFTVNIRGNSGTTLNSQMAIGQSITIALLVTNGATAYYANAFQVDGASITPKWQGGTAPTSGNTLSVDIYSFTVVKTASATFTMFASQSQFK